MINKHNRFSGFYLIFKLDYVLQFTYPNPTDFGKLPRQYQNIRFMLLLGKAV